MAETRPSRWWTSAAALTAVCALSFAAAAVAVQTESSRPIGEGDLFVSETARIVDILLDDAEPLDLAVRRARAEFDVESVSVVGPDGSIVASSSDTLFGTSLEGPLAFGHFDRRLVAVAGPQRHPVEVDSVPVWEAGDTLYAVVQELDAEASVLVHYDVSSLLAKRVRPVGLTGPAIGLAVAAAFAALAVGFILIGRERAVRHYREAAQEAELAQAHSRELEGQNAALARARAAAERALALAEEKNRIRSEFVLMINHELRTPLTSVTTGARLLEDEHLTEADRSMILAGMIADAERLESIIDHVLAVARIENQGIESPVVPVPAEELLESINAALPRGATVEPITPLADKVATTDRLTLSQLIASLADNAFTHGASNVRVEVDSGRRSPADLVLGTRAGSTLDFAVVDDGPGIDPDFLPRAFEKFEKQGFASGTGLGLYLAKLMAEAIGASMAVTTGPDGTTMTVSVAVTEIDVPEVATV